MGCSGPGTGSGLSLKDRGKLCVDRISHTKSDSVIAEEDWFLIAEGRGNA